MVLGRYFEALYLELLLFPILDTGEDISQTPSGGSVTLLNDPPVTKKYLFSSRLHVFSLDNTIFLTLLA